MIYLASPYAHPDADIRDERYRLACKAQVKLMRAGMSVFCPIAAHAGLLSMLLTAEERNSHEFWMKQDLPILERCISVHVLCLAGWHTSKGIAAEVAHAAKWKKSVIYLGSDYVE
jgi:hypothetical protein